MSAIEVPFFTKVGEPKGNVELPSAVFAGDVSRHVLFEVVTSLRANLRGGTSNTKTRGEVRGGGRKPWKQKGTGNARAGSNRSPLWRKGGITFGPHPRSYRTDLGRVKRDLALRTALSEKVQSSQIGVFESLPEGEGRTSKMSAFLNKAGISGRTTFVVSQKTPLLKRAIGNVRDLALVDVHELNALMLMQAGRVFFTREALDSLTSRIIKS